MPSLSASILTSLFAGIALFGQDMSATLDYRRERLEGDRREIAGSLADKAWMQDGTRASVVRTQIQRGWKDCAEIEALALATNSERPARLLTETALTKCKPWQTMLESALTDGAYPYVETPDRPGRVSREDMVAVSGLEARDAALTRILTWRQALTNSPQLAAAKVPPPVSGVSGPIKPKPIPDHFAPPEPETKKPEPAAESEDGGIVVVGRVRPGCRVRLADIDLTEAQLAAKAREWAANGTALKLIRPRGSDYRCMAKLTFDLGQQGLRLFQFVEAER